MAADPLSHTAATHASAVASSFGSCTACNAASQGGAAEGALTGVQAVDSHDPEVWGPPAWRFLHCMSRSLPDTLPLEMQRSFEHLMRSLPHVLPCKPCGENMLRHLADDPVGQHLGTREEVQRWLYHLHNAVNADLGKPLLTDAEAARVACAGAGSGDSAIAAQSLVGHVAQASCSALLSIYRWRSPSDPSSTLIPVTRVTRRELYDAFLPSVP